MITFLLTPGQESDIRQAEELMETGAIRRRSGQMRLRPQRLVVFYKRKSAHFINEKVPTLKEPTLKLLSKRGPLYKRKVAHFCFPQRTGDRISIA
ncbi:MAG: hypothetical protein FJ031_14565 [Chloroflexi bacterium]|nr:hypothetical protein [Chloroflexota bacterium]